jgi:hypothetical protein
MMMLASGSFLLAVLAAVGPAADPPMITRLSLLLKDRHPLDTQIEFGVNSSEFGETPFQASRKSVPGMKTKFRAMNLDKKLPSEP